MSKLGGRDSIYQQPPNDGHGLGNTVWQAGANFLFVQHTAVILVAETGGKVSADTTLRIARKIFEKINSAIASESFKDSPSVE